MNLKRDILLIGVAFLFTCAVFAGVINPVLAACDEYDDWSNDETAYAYVRGCYISVGNPYYSQKHEGNITEGNVWRYAFTQFIGKDQSSQIVYNPSFPLANNTGKTESYDYENIYHLRTITDSGYGTIPQSKVEVLVGPPGAGP